MILVIQNNQLTSVVLNSELGTVPPRRTVTIPVTIAQLEAIRPTLVRLASTGAISWATNKNPDSSDDGAEGATIAYVDGSGPGGFVTGPISSTNNAVPRFDGVDGTSLKDSVVTVSDGGNISTPGTVDGRDVSVDGAKLDTIETNADVTDAANVAAAGAVMDSDFAGSNVGFLRRVGAGSYTVLQDNLLAVVGPTSSSDSSLGYSVGSLWVDVVARQIYFCADASVGAAVWRQIGAGGGVTDHGALTGLSDDDHTQYLLVNGTRAMTGDLDMGGQDVSNVGTVDGRDVSADGTKLDTIETNADVTDATNVAAAGAVMDSDFTGTHVGTLERTGVGLYRVIRNNLSSVTSPTASDDSTQNYQIGSLWLNTITGRLRICVDATPGAAVWRPDTEVGGLVTGWLAGGILSINGGDPARFDLSSGNGLIVDDSVPEFRNITPVSWGAFTSVVLTNLATQDFSWIGIDSAGAIVQIGGRAPTSAERRDNIWLGRVVHANRTTISFFIDAPIGAGAPEYTGIDLAAALGVFNVDGNVYSSTGANLILQRTSGAIWRLFSNIRTDFKTPHVVSLLAASPIASFNYRYRNGLGGWTEAPAAQVVPNLYDDGTGTLAAVPANRWTIQRIRLSTTGLTIAKYGQALYTSKAEARANIFATIASDPALSETVLRAYLIVRGNATNLQDPDNEFIEVSSGVAGGGGGGSSITDHGLLSGLADDDHTQYLLVNGTRAMTGGLDMGNQAISNALTVNSRTMANLVDLAGQLGGTASSPDVRGVRETSGPTLLTMGAVADGEYFRRSGTSVIGGIPGGGSSTFRGIRGFTLANYLEAATPADLAGNASPGFEIYGLLNVDGLLRGSLVVNNYIASTASEFVGPGYHLWLQGDRPRHSVTDGGGTLLSNFLQEWLLGTTFRKPLIPISMGFNGTTRFLKIAGQTIFSAAMTGYTSSANPFRVGRPGGAATSGALENATLFALAAKTDGILTDADHEEALRVFLSTGDLPNGVFTSRWSFASLSVGAVPAMVPDAIGSNDLTLVGSLNVVDDKFSGLALVGDPAATSVKIGGQIGGSTTVPDIRGVRETSGPTLLTMGAVGDGKLFQRSGSTIIGGAVATEQFMQGFGSHPSDATQRAAWELPDNALDGQTAWTVFSVYARIGEPVGEELVWSSSNVFGADGGARLRQADTVFNFDFVDSAAAFTNASSSPEDAYRRQVRMVVQVFDNGNVLGSVDGYFANCFISGAAGAFNSNGRNIHIGSDAAGATADPSTQAGGLQSHALAYWGYTLRVVTATEIRAWFRACMRAAGFADIPSGGGLTRAYRASDANLGAGTWAPFIGTGTASKIGTKALSLVTLPLDW